MIVELVFFWLLDYGCLGSQMDVKITLSRNREISVAMPLLA